MLKTEMINKLNDQLNLELYSSLLYQQMSAWCHQNGFDGSATFLKKHAEEERDHMQRLFKYLVDTGSMPFISDVKAPVHEFTSLENLYKKTFSHEQYITEKINELAQLAITSHDYSTFNFLQWYVAEQHEEEKIFKSILDKLALVGTSGQALYIVDRDLNAQKTTP